MNYFGTLKNTLWRTPVLIASRVLLTGKKLHLCVEQELKRGPLENLLKSPKVKYQENLNDKAKRLYQSSHLKQPPTKYGTPRIYQGKKITGMLHTQGSHHKFSDDPKFKSFVEEKFDKEIKKEMLKIQESLKKKTKRSVHQTRPPSAMPKFDFTPTKSTSKETGSKKSHSTASTSAIPEKKPSSSKENRIKKSHSSIATNAVLEKNIPSISKETLSKKSHSSTSINVKLEKRLSSTSKETRSSSTNVTVEKNNPSTSKEIQSKKSHSSTSIYVPLEKKISSPSKETRNKNSHSSAPTSAILEKRIQSTSKETQSKKSHSSPPTSVILEKRLQAISKKIRSKKTHSSTSTSVIMEKVHPIPTKISGPPVKILQSSRAQSIGLPLESPPVQSPREIQARKIDPPKAPKAQDKLEEDEKPKVNIIKFTFSKAKLPKVTENTLIDLNKNKFSAKLENFSAPKLEVSHTNLERNLSEKMERKPHSKSSTLSFHQTKMDNNKPYLETLEEAYFRRKKLIEESNRRNLGTSGPMNKVKFPIPKFEFVPIKKVTEKVEGEYEDAQEKEDKSPQDVPKDLRRKSLVEEEACSRHQKNNFRKPEYNFRKPEYDFKKQEYNFKKQEYNFRTSSPINKVRFPFPKREFVPIKTVTEKVENFEDEEVEIEAKPPQGRRGNIPEVAERNDNEEGEDVVEEEVVKGTTDRKGKSGRMEHRNGYSSVVKNVSEGENSSSKTTDKFNTGHKKSSTFLPPKKGKYEKNQIEESFEPSETKEIETEEVEIEEKRYHDDVQRKVSQAMPESFKTGGITLNVNPSIFQPCRLPEVNPENYEDIQMLSKPKKVNIKTKFQIRNEDFPDVKIMEQKIFDRLRFGRQDGDSYERWVYPGNERMNTVIETVNNYLQEIVDNAVNRCVHVTTCGAQVVRKHSLLMLPFALLTLGFLEFIFEVVD